MLIFLVVVVIIVVLLLTKTKCYQHIYNFWGRYHFAKTLPGPPFYDLIGNATENDALNWVVELTQKYGRVVRVWFGVEITVFVTDPDYVKAILSSTELIEKSTDYEILEPWLGKGLLTNGGASWHQQRKLLTPAFHFNILKTFRPQIEECCNILFEQLSLVADGEQNVDIYPFISLFSLDVICDTAMGVKTNYQLNSDSNYVQATRTVCQITIEQMFSMLQAIPIFFYFAPNYEKKRAALKVLHDQTKRVIQTRRTEMSNNISTDSNNTDDDIGRKQRFAFLDSLLRAQLEGAQLTDEMIEDEVNTFMFEGHDTTSSAISFAIYALSQHEDFQRRAREEVLVNENLDSTPFLEAFIKETLRMYPAVPYYSRNVVEPFQMGPYLIPRSVTVAVFAYMVHRDEELYPNPDEFNPERFLSEEPTHPYSFVAFSAGPRNCIGQRFAMLEMKCALSKILRSFDILPANGFSLNMCARLILGSSNGIQVRLRKREK